MIKKFVSMATAAILLATGISVLAAPAANALPTLTALLYLVGNNGVSVPDFSSGTTSYTINTENDTGTITSATPSAGATVVYKCKGTVVSSGASCALTSGANAYTVEVTDGSGTNTYTVNFNYNPPTGPVLASTSTITAGQVNPTLVITSSVNFTSTNINAYTFNLGTTSLTVGTLSGSSTSTLTIQLTGTASAGTLTFQIPGMGGFLPASNTLSFLVAAGSSSSSSSSTPTQTAAEIAAAAEAAAKAAAQAAAEARAAEIAVAQTKLATVLKGDKAGTIGEYAAANVYISTAASLARINAEVLKLSANDRSDFTKIKAIADKIEFDESFFNATARPTLSTYARYEVVGITERILPTVNTKVLELPAAVRVDTKAIQEIIKVESFVDLVANTQTRGGVSSQSLIQRGLLPADTPYKHSVRSGLGSYPEGSLNTMEKIEAAIKEQIYKAEAPKRRLAEIKAKIAARNK